ncbi:ScbA/BarX family gamma-butyrolactone biosynthesis protein [Streptomyces sp. SID14478]|uniref:ScbA/BarX family gamma-butyrolactone biosynthesis protein n=1 Tax=Streptomyces sp. SID14478 TaxID=2706073 RepID=UPI001EF19BF8|nr:ScbA/BarX family gamma-butyrolactone biosynthesis protein [Streptomyces sp. SID14478]
MTFLRPVARELVHRSSVAEVFITDGVPVGDDRFVVAAQWPRDHALYHPDENGLSDPLLFAETLRQGMVYLAHQHCGIPLGRRFVFRDLDFEVTDPASLRVSGTPQSVLLEGTWSWVGGTGRGGRAEARLDVTLVADGRTCGRGSACMLMIDERRYNLLRRMAPSGTTEEAGAPPAPRAVVAPYRVGRLRWRDCVLERGDAPDDWVLRVDRNHAVLFDHPTDHIPLMVQLEGIRQLGHLAVHEAHDGRFAELSFALTRATVECLAFGEFQQPVRLVVEERSPAGPRDAEPYRLRIAAVQGDTVLTRAETTWECVGARVVTAAPAAW